MPAVEPLVRAALDLRRELRDLAFSDPVTHVYNPLEYAWLPHKAYLTRYGRGPKHVVFLGMNPGPFGMAQTGVPFGEIAAVRDWLSLEGKVERPDHEHPKRPIEGFACQRSEVSGRRLWGLFAERFKTPEAFFADHYVSNYCPLVFMEDSGRNRTPDKIPLAEMEPVYAACNRHLRRIIEILEPRHAVGVGGFALNCLKSTLAGTGIPVHAILHPSPASPAANRDWAGTVTKQLEDAGIW